MKNVLSRDKLTLPKPPGSTERVRSMLRGQGLPSPHGSHHTHALLRLVFLSPLKFPAFLRHFLSPFLLRSAASGSQCYHRIGSDSASPSVPRTFQF